MNEHLLLLVIDLHHLSFVPLVDGVFGVHNISHLEIPEILYNGRQECETTPKGKQDDANKYSKTNKHIVCGTELIRSA